MKEKALKAEGFYFFWFSIPSFIAFEC